MDAGRLIRGARTRSGLTLRQLGEAAGTSHSTLSAYESGRTIPNVATLGRILRAAGFAVDVTLSPRVDGAERGRELAEVLDLAAQFPARHAAHIEYPKFGVVR